MTEIYVDKIVIDFALSKCTCSLCSYLLYNSSRRREVAQKFLFPDGNYDSGSLFQDKIDTLKIFEYADFVLIFLEINVVSKPS